MLGAECRPRALCVAQHCGERDHLNDDLHIVTLPQELILIARAASIFDRASTRRPVSRSSSAATSDIPGSFIPSAARD
jgi:hypothetical protein